MKLNMKDLFSGLIFILFGLVYGSMTLAKLSVGSALNMGPGFFPIVLSGLLVAGGLGVAAHSLITVPREPFGTVPWRAIILITASTVFFALFFEDLGMFPAVAGQAFMTAFCSRLARPLTSAIAAIVLATFCSLLFVEALNLPVSVFGPWFGGY